MTTPSIPSTSITLFRNSTPPTGWTKLTTNNDCMLRVTSNASITTSGSISFSSGLVNSIATSATASFPTVTLSTTVSDVASHNHNGGTLVSYTNRYTGTTLGPTQQGVFAAGGAQTQTQPTYGLFSPSGAGHSHTGSMPGTYPSFPFTGSTLNFGVNYIDLIVAQRN